MELTKKEIGLLVIGTILSAISVTFSTEDGATPISMAITAVYVLLVFFCNDEQKLYLVALAISNTKALNIAGASGAVCVTTIAAILSFSKLRNKGWIVVVSIIYILYCLQYLMDYGDMSQGLVMPIKAVFTMAFFYSLSQNESIAENAFNVGLKTSVFIFAGIFIGLYATITKSTYAVEDGRLSVIGNDPNILAIEAVFVLSYMCVAYFKSRTLNTTFFYASAFILLFVCIMSASRMGLLLVAFTLIMAFISNATSFKQLLPFLIVGGICIAAIVMSSYGQTAIEALTMRMEVLDSKGDASNGRFELWEKYIGVLNNNPILWLVGFGSQTNVGIEDQAHNFIIETIASNGILGMAFFYGCYAKIFKNTRRLYSLYGRDRLNLQRKWPFLLPFVGGMTLHSLSNIINITILFVAVLGMATCGYNSSKLR